MAIPQEVFRSRVGDDVWVPGGHDGHQLFVEGEDSPHQTNDGLVVGLSNRRADLNPIALVEQPVVAVRIRRQRDSGLEQVQGGAEVATFYGGFPQ